MISSLFIVVLCFTIANSQRDNTSFSGDGSGSETAGPTNTTLFPAFQEPPITYGNLSCDLYTSGGYCQLVLPQNVEVITNHSRVTQIEAKRDLDLIFNVLSGRAGTSSKSSRYCQINAVPLLCHFTFPYCDPAFIIPVYQPICQWDCRIMRDFICTREWEGLKRLGGLVDFRSIDPFNCEILQNNIAGEAPMCISTLDGGDIPASLVTNNCYFGKGRGYSGIINITESGYTCEIWTLRYPHPHLLSEYYYPEIRGGHNYCRNPGTRGERPWCFTTNRTVRWEYCNVPKCDSGPTCERYTGSLCRTNGSIGMNYIYIDTSIATQSEYETDLAKVFETLRNFPECITAMTELLCHMTFPLCDLSYSHPRPRKICRSYCMSVKNINCSRFYDNFNRYISVLGINYIKLPGCHGNYTDPMAGGSSPECIKPITRSGPITNSSVTCYNSTTNGTDYTGTTNITESGLICQSWDSSIPHIHPITSLFRPYLEGHNYCRNPEGRGSRPWCYTTNATVRWEYCSISVCSTYTDNEPTPQPTLQLKPQPKPLLSLHHYYIIGGGGALIVLIVVFILCCCCCCCCKLHTKSKTFVLNDKSHEIIENIPMQYAKRYKAPNPLYCKKPVLQDKDLMGEYQDVKLPEYNRDKLVYICDLGEGHFGLVIRAEATGIVPNEEKANVAVKVLKEGASESAKKEFFREAALMAGFDHFNILKLLGVCIEQEPLCMIFEYMSMGDLNNFLRQNTPAHLRSFPCSGPKTLPNGISVKQLVDISKDISAGLAYLSFHHYVHRDLASRNCLVSNDLRVKIADFGLSQDVYTNDYFRLGDSELLPIRWMPPESIMFSKFSTQSDVWSFGIVLWEIFSYGIQPYFGMSNEEVVQYIRDGSQLKRPQGCPQEIYDLMCDCWMMNPAERPKAEEISTGLQRWTPEMSATLEVQAKHPDYQNMSTILEWARQALENGNYNTLENSSHLKLDENQAPPTDQGYDHLTPVTNDNKDIGEAVKNGELPIY